CFSLPAVTLVDGAQRQQRVAAQGVLSLPGSRSRQNPTTHYCAYACVVFYMPEMVSV
ncbi:hypothetical protein M9458_005247, partial [Cirrhinus mrigala]